MPCSVPVKLDFVIEESAGPVWSSTVERGPIALCVTGRRGRKTDGGVLMEEAWDILVKSLSALSFAPLAHCSVCGCWEGVL